MKREDLSDCVTSEELSRLFDEAFTMWRARKPDPEGRRLSPRIPTGMTKPVFVSSYLYEGRQITLNRRAMLVDVSADGLGMMFPDALPVGAALHFAFETKAGERDQGVACVVSTTEHPGGYRIGLIFTDTAQSLDIGLAVEEAPVSPSPACGWRSTLKRLRQAANIAFRTTTRRTAAHRELRKHHNGKEILFVVDARLFRYTASLFVDGRKIASRCGVLRDRVCGLFSEAACPTVIYLERGGFYASATLQSNAVTDCTLEVIPRLLHVSFPPIPDLPIPPPSPHSLDSLQSAAVPNFDR